jgi:hypothetical protein
MKYSLKNGFVGTLAGLALITAVSCNSCSGCNKEVEKGLFDGIYQFQKKVNSEEMSKDIYCRQVPEFDTWACEGNE